MQEDTVGKIEDLAPRRCCETCNAAGVCLTRRIAGEPGEGFPCWEGDPQRPRDMTCVLSLVGPPRPCQGSRCFMWSQLDADGTGTCLLALLAAKMAGDACHGTAVEEGGVS